MNITIVGGGNVGLQFAVHCAEKRNKVTIYSSKYNKIEKDLAIVNEKGEILHKAKIDTVTYKEKEAFESAELIFVTLPAFMMDEIAKKIYPYVNCNTKIAIIPGTGGGECAFKQCIDKGATVFGLQRVPSVARICEPGKKVCATGYRKELFVSSIPNKYTDECCKIIQDLFDMKCSSLPNYLNLTLTPSNPILHTTRLNRIFEDYTEGVLYDKLPLFYEHWDNDTSKLLFECDTEVQNICKKLKDFDLTYVKSLKEHYESDTINKLTKKIQSIDGFKGLTTPSKLVKEKYIPDLNSRYFTADFNYGLYILIQIADFVDVDVPNMRKVWNWYKTIMVFNKCFQYNDYDIINYETFKKFYLR